MGVFNIENAAGVVAANTGVWSPANPNAAPYGNSAGCAEPPAAITQLWVPDRGQKDYLAARPETALQNSRAESLVAFLNTKADFASIFGSLPGSFHRDTQPAPNNQKAERDAPARVADAKSEGAPYGSRIVKASYELDRGSSPRVSKGSVN